MLLGALTPAVAKEEPAEFALAFEEGLKGLRKAEIVLNLDVRGGEGSWVVRANIEGAIFSLCWMDTPRMPESMD